MRNSNAQHGVIGVASLDRDGDSVRNFIVHDGARVATSLVRNGENMPSSSTQYLGLMQILVELNLEVVPIFQWRIGVNILTFKHLLGKS